MPQDALTDRSPGQLYLDLLKKTLHFSLWEDPGKPIESVAYRAGVGAALVRGVAALLKKVRLRLVVLRDMDQERRYPGSTWPAYAHTMVSRQRLDNLQQLVTTVLQENVPGDLIETGVWRGGSCIFMKAILAVHGEATRRVFVADSFAGLPKPNAAQYPSDAGDEHHVHDFLAVSREQVEENFRKYGLLDERVVFLKGWFKDTLPVAPIQQLALMRLDGDMYESTMDALVHLYPKLSAGGFCIIDDYALAGCQKAVDDFRTREKITAPLVEIDHTGRFWRKS
ncbi:MAG TPA: TylF/MycF family methyltransferase [Verrucomicrobiota bacterium]|nr:TylF/MycF family methyltransferase [Verrucomicrobiota bacterium]HNT16221.1 TylF/MycF family methyltransferase [Verrucomicrobiota bacterium]